MLKRASPPGGNELFPSSAWRLLLPDPNPWSVAVLGTGPASSTARTVGRRQVPPAQADAELAVADDLDPSTIARAFESLAPGGTAYLEARWPRAGAVAGLVETLSEAGFGQVRIYSLSVSDDRWRTSWWIPVDEPGVVAYLLQQRRPGASRRFRVAIGTMAPNTIDRLRTPASRCNRSPRPTRIPALRARVSTLSTGAVRLLADLLNRIIARRPGLLHPSRPETLCVVAVKPSVAARPSASPGLVQACKPFGDTESRDRSAVAMRVGGSSTDQPMMLLFDRGRPEPAAIIKVPNRPEELTATRHEFRTLQALASGNPPVASVPRPIALRDVPGIVALAQRAMPGRAMTANASPASFETLARTVTDWLVELAVATRRPCGENWYRDLTESSVRVLDGSTSNSAPLLPSLDRARRALAGFDPGVVVMRHCDLGPWNIQLDRSGRIGVIDWAGAEAQGPTGCDLIHFLTHLALCANDAYEPSRRQPVVASLVAPGSAAGAVVDRCLDRYFGPLGIDRPPDDELRILTWMLALRRQTPVERPGSIYCALLAEELDRFAISPSGGPRSERQRRATERL